MNPEDVGRILDEIGERIGPAGEYAWTITVRQVVIDAAVWMVFGCVLIVGVLVGAIAIRRWGLWYRDQPNYSSGSDIRHAEWVILGFAIPIAAIPIVVSLTSLLNPEYHAMIRLLERVVAQ